MLDQYWQGPTARISPEAPVPVVHITQRDERPGGAGNVALNIAALGAQASIDGLVGNDRGADALMAFLRNTGIECLFEHVPGLATIVKLRVLSSHQQLIRLDFEEGFYHHDPRALFDRYRAALTRCDAVVLSDYGKGTLSGVGTLIQLARGAGKPVLVDPKGRDFDIYRGATLLTPNTAEFCAVAGECRSDAEFVEKGTRLRDALDLGALLITRGEHGMTLLERGRDPLHLPAQAREVFDVTGAGDTVIGVLAAALAAGLPLGQATQLANLAAGLVVAKLGAATVSPAELRSALDAAEHDAAAWPTGVVTEDRLLELVGRARQQGDRIVMTNGCFDLLHAGHVTYLEKARQLGDRLIVAVNDDASVSRLKGNDRPLNALANRMMVLAGLRCVDWVVPFSEDTPERVICRVLPDVLVKGGDYAVHEVAGHRCVRDAGGEVIIIDLVPGVSTTAVIQRARKNSRD
jgi:D-beta-D-heptose 7-phosphate kinase/D-beta-D-heptose 1-phosphate adenosyltransferase